MQIERWKNTFHSLARDINGEDQATATDVKVGNTSPSCVPTPAIIRHEQVQRLFQSLARLVWRSGGGQATLDPMQSSDTRGCWSCLYYTPRPSHRVESAASAQTCRHVALRLLHWQQKQGLAGCINTCHLNRPPQHTRSAGHWLQYPVAVIVGAFVVMAQAASGRPPCLTKQAQLQRV